MLAEGVRLIAAEKMSEAAAVFQAALDIAAKGLVKIRDNKGVKALAGFGSAKGSNEEAYLFQKLVRTGFGSNNVVPAPGALALVGLGGLVATRRRR